MTNKDLYTPPCAESVFIQTEQSMTVYSYNSTDSTEVFGRGSEEDL